MSTLSHTRSRSRDISSPKSPLKSPHIHSPLLSPPPRSPSPPSQTFHAASILPSVPTPSLLESVAGAAHYSGVKLDPEAIAQKRRRRSLSAHRASEDGEVGSAAHQRVLDDLKELFCCRPTTEIFERSWRKDATFQDPLSVCTGYDEYAAQWYGLAKLCSKSETLSSRVMSSTSIPNRIVYHQKQEYTFAVIGRTKVIESIVIVDLDENDKIVTLTDQWGGKELPTRYGSGLLRLLNAKITPWLIRVPKLES
ncbi:hypothetical protein D9611_004314 [Ephemerocybe angulata]|uniref:Uncharacterized protein n=1 Tax=Ephemerocybe angulata TaxID=980116 RepID=A0A8H5F5D9_9AGAR|nr:hypothetical protein D9611_004314 [Tulosesus angulatus]